MVRLGILGCSEIAYRRFMPAVLECDGVEVVVVGEEYAPVKLKEFCEKYSLESTTSFDEIINRSDLDAVYIPQPPALHYEWAKKALEHGKHVFLEKPSTISFHGSEELVCLAREKKLTLHENYMFQYHSQISRIIEMVNVGKIGDVRLFRADFTFPRRDNNDFRYNKNLGGGALLDAGGYTLKLATILLGESIRLDSANLSYLPDFEVDMYGAAQLRNQDGKVCQVSFGMDNSYRCSLEVYGSRGKLITNRIFTAPPDYQPKVYIEALNGTEEILLDSDSHFRKSIDEFVNEISDESKREDMYKQIIIQARLVEDLREKSKE